MEKYKYFCRYTYDNNGKTKSIVDAALNPTTYTYDAASRLALEHTGLGNRLYTYDNVNNRISATDRNHRTTAYTYDNLNRVNTETWVSGNKQFTYTYDQNSNLTSADDGTRHYNYTYDDTDLLIREDRSSAAALTVSFTYDYDKVGNLLETDQLIAGSITATTTYNYDPRNLNTEILQSGAGLTAKRVKFTYDPYGQNTKVERYLGATTTSILTTDNTYDHGRLIEIKQTNATSIITDSTYGYDNLSRLISETKDGIDRLISYDNIDQVKTVTGSNTEAYNYDLNGNRISGGNVPGVNNQLTTDGIYNYQYDGEGNRTNRTKIVGGAVDDYTWDYRNRLTTVQSKNGAGVVTQTVAYEYDVDDQRVKRTINGVVENYYLDGQQIAFVTDGSGNQTFHYLYGTNVDSVLAQDTPTGMVWSLSDRLGSVDTLTDASGVVVDKRTFDSFGRVLSETNPSVSFRYGYTGRERDLESGLEYYRARYYDPANGVFISVDPMGFGAGDTNLYRYVGNSSTLATDPSGMASWLEDAWNSGVRNVQQGLNNAGRALQQGLNTAGQVVNNTVQSVQQFGINTVQSISQSAASIAQTVGDYAYGGLVTTDRVVAGLAGFATGGYTDRYREEQFGDKIAGQSDSFEYALGQSLGFGITTVLGVLTPQALLGKVGVGGRIAQGYTITQVGKGAYDTTTKIIDGKMDWSNPWSYVETVATFSPLLGPIARQLGKIGVVENAFAKATAAAENVLSSFSQKAAPYLTKATAAAENIWGNITQQASNSLNKATSVASDFWRKITQNCFIAGTEIQTLDGTKNIEDIHVGDWVLSDDPYTPGEIEYKQVLQTFAHDTTKFVDIYIGGEKITTTDEHPFWVPDVGWVLAKDLHAGSHLQTKTESWLDIDKVELHGGLATVYNFEVQGFHTYFVSALGLLVHNVCDPKDLPTLNIKQAGKALQSPAANVNVKLNTREEANQLLKKFIEGGGYRNSTGYNGNQVRQNKDLFPNGKNGTFHWDYADTQHGGVPHVQIHDFKGKIHHIFFENGGGLPITGGDLNQLREQMNRLSGL